MRDRVKLKVSEDPVTESDGNLHAGATEKVSNTANISETGEELDPKFMGDRVKTGEELDPKFMGDRVKPKVGEDPVTESDGNLHDGKTEKVSITANISETGEEFDPKFMGDRVKPKASMDPVIESDGNLHHCTTEKVSITAEPFPADDSTIDDRFSHVSEDIPSNVSKQGQGDILTDIKHQPLPKKLSKVFSNLVDGPDLHPLSAKGIGSSKNNENVDGIPLAHENSHQIKQECQVGKIVTKNCDRPPLEIERPTMQVIKNEDLQDLMKLGSGAFGTVHREKWRGADVAVKRLKKECFTCRSSEQERRIAEFQQEAEILATIHHPNVVTFYGVVRDEPGRVIAIVSEFMVDGSLAEVLFYKRRYFDHRQRLIIAMDVAFGMEYLHKNDIVHFDLKCNNLLVNLKDPIRPICKIGDFGTAKIKLNSMVSGGLRGTLAWMAPELMHGENVSASEKVDVFSFGVVLWEILTGKVDPYPDKHHGEIIGGILYNTLRPTIPSDCDLEWRKLMKQCWAHDPAARPSFTEIASRLRKMYTAGTSKMKTRGNRTTK